MEVRARRDAEANADTDRVQPPDQALHIGARLDGGDLIEDRARRCEAGRIDAAFVHAGAEEIARELLCAARRPVAASRHLIEDAAHVLLVELPGLPAPAPAIHVIGDRVLLAPRA